MPWFIAVLFLALASCAQAPISSSGLNPLPRAQYASLIKRNTANTNQYSGFYQTFQADVTILTSEVQAESLKQKAEFLQWDGRIYQNEREKMLQEASAYSKFFLRFFSPEQSHDDLDKVKSMWKIYLDYGGNRFEGKVRKVSDKLADVQNLYPHVDRFSSIYEVSFNVPMTTLEQGSATFSLTSSLGSAKFTFPNPK